MAIKNIDSYRPPLFQEFPQENLQGNLLEEIREAFGENPQVQQQILAGLQQNPVIAEAIAGAFQEVAEVIEEVPTINQAVIAEALQGAIMRALEGDIATQQAILEALGENPVNQAAILEVLQTDPFLEAIAGPFQQAIVDAILVAHAQGNPVNRAAFIEDKACFALGVLILSVVVASIYYYQPYPPLTCIASEHWPAISNHIANAERFVQRSSLDRTRNTFIILQEALDKMAADFSTCKKELDANPHFISDLIYRPTICALAGGPVGPFKLHSPATYWWNYVLHRESLYSQGTELLKAIYEEGSLDLLSHYYQANPYYNFLPDRYGSHFRSDITWTYFNTVSKILDEANENFAKLADAAKKPYGNRYSLEKFTKLQNFVESVWEKHNVTAKMLEEPLFDLSWCSEFFKV